MQSFSSLSTAQSQDVKQMAQIAQSRTWYVAASAAAAAATASAPPWLLGVRMVAFLLLGMLEGLPQLPVRALMSIGT